MWTTVAIIGCLVAGLRAAPERPEGGLVCPRSQGLFSHPYDCHKFLHCDHGHPYVKDCPGNLHFHASLMVCDWPENAGCVPGQPTEPPTPVVPPEPDMECDCECCLKPNPADCTTFYMCKDGKAWLQACSTGLVFNPNVDNCDLPSNYQCSATTPKVTTEKPTTPKITTPSGFVCPSDGMFPNPKDCHTFYHCSNGHAYLKDCPANLDFNPATQRCDYPEHAGCRYPVTTMMPPPPPSSTPKPVTTPKPVPGWQCPSSNGLFPDPADCHKFYHCSNGIPYHKDCPANLDFNPVLKVCDWPEHAGCRGPAPTSEPTEEPIPEPTADPSVICPDDTCVCRVPFPGNCTKFYQCKDGKAYPTSCPAGLVFNPAIEVCDLPEHVPGCKPTPKPTTVPTPKPTTTPKLTTTTHKPGWQCPTSNGLFPDPADCHKFYHCSNGIPYHKVCPANLDFNPVLKVCDWPEHAGCRGPAPTPDPTEVPTPQPTPDSDIVCPDDNCVCRLPYPNDCTKFYQCKSGEAFPASCPKGLVFNFATEVCDIPANVPGCKLPRKTLQSAAKLEDESQYCPSPDGKFRASECHHYYHCKEGVPTLKRCLHGTRFYAPKQRCILGSC